MTAQMDMFAPALNVDIVEPPERVMEQGTRPSISERFDAFHNENPHVYEQLRVLALGLVRRGRTRIGIGMLFEVLRWQRMIATTGEPYKLNNDYRSRYARMLAAAEPELADAFETRELKS